MKISLILGEVCDLYLGLNTNSRIKLLPKKQLNNIVNLVVLELHSQDNSLRLNGLKFLRVLTDDYPDIVGSFMERLANLMQVCELF